MKHSMKKLLSLVLALMMAVSLLSGTVVFGAEEPFEAATVLEQGYEYIVATEENGVLYALTALETTDYEAGVYFDKCAVVNVENGKVNSIADGAVWKLIKDDVLRTVYFGNVDIFAGSGGFMTFNGGRSFKYDPETSLVTLHSKYYLTFADGKFDQTEKASEACIVKLFRRAGELEAPEDPNNWEGKIDPATVPETNNVETIYKSAVKHDDGSIVLAFTSDVHYDGVNNNLATWLPLAEKTYGYIDTMGFCGDMGSAYVYGDAYWDAAGEIMKYMDGEIAAGNVGSVTYTFGNHEWFLMAGGEYYNNHESEAAKRLLRTGPSVVTDDYIIYNFGASPDAALDWLTYGYNTKHMYTYYESDLAALDTYLAGAPKDIPIFILTHYPLHDYSDRIISNAAEIVEVLNKYPNVVLLWGHNHSESDPGYFDICHAGDKIVVDGQGTTVTVNFDYLAAGTTADKEYTSPEEGSAWTLNKGLIVTIGADGKLTYDYVAITGDVIKENDKTIVAYRNNIDWTITKVEYVDKGTALTLPAAPEIKYYKFKEWTAAGADLNNIDHPTLVTAYYDEATEVVKSPQVFKVNGADKNLDAYNINGNNYLKLRDVAALMNGTGSSFSVAYNAETKSIATVKGEAYTAVGGELAIGNDNSATAVKSQQTITVNDAAATPAMYNIGGNNYLKLRDLGDLFGFEVSYDDATNTAIITAK